MSASDSLSSDDEVIHYYAGWPGKVLCEGKTSLPISPISSMNMDHVTCMRCKEMLDKPFREVVGSGI